ncbi:MAG: hypothetical protein IH840_14935 [Candidatus Heimdallarchaeota archaeon]|nr:hypothetical protein [Candidatus Heimdallarchaeota archaeon]
MSSPPHKSELSVEPTSTNLLDVDRLKFDFKISREVKEKITTDLEDDDIYGTFDAKDGVDIFLAQRFVTMTADLIHRLI